MSNSDPIEKIGKIAKGETSGVAPIEERIPGARTAPNREHFDNLMLQPDKTAAGAAAVGTEPAKASLMDAVRDLNYAGNKTGPVSRDTLVVQTQEAVSQIEEIKSLLGSPQIQIKSSVQELLHNKLTHIDDNLKIALSKAGIEYNPTHDAVPAGRVNPIERFLGFLTDGQWQLQNLGNEIQAMSIQGKELTPTNMLAIQVKVSQVQQELELFTAMLSKALESIKTIMNIQV